MNYPTRATPKSLEEAISNGLENMLELEEHNQEAVKDISVHIAHHVRDYIRNKMMIPYMKIKDPEVIHILEQFMEKMGHFKK